MPLLPEHKDYHALGPKDVGINGEKKAAFMVDVLRTTNHTGEQLHLQVPVYGDETREELTTRLNWAYSVIQDRLEDENKAIEWMNKRDQVIRNCAEAAKRNEESFKKQVEELNKVEGAKVKRLEKLLSKGGKDEAEIDKITDEIEAIKADHEKKHKDLVARFEKANEILNAKIEHAQKERELNEELPLPDVVASAEKPKLEVAPN